MQIVPVLTLIFLVFVIVTVFVPSFPPAQFLYEATRMPHPPVPESGLSIGTLMYGFTNGFFWVLVAAIAFGVASGMRRTKPLPPMPVAPKLSTPLLVAREVDDRWTQTLPSTTVTVNSENDSASALASLLEFHEEAPEPAGMKQKVEFIQGIDSIYAGLLKNAGVRSVSELLNTCAREAVRRRIATEVGVSYQMLTKWVHQADLLRVKGVDSKCSALLESAGVTTVFDLSTRDAISLSKRLRSTNREMKLISGRTPPVKIVQGWVDESKNLRPMVE